MALEYCLYFLLGGIIVSAVTYFANNARGLFAAFIGTLPIITISTFLLVYLNAGQAAVLAYAKGLVIMIIPWLIFIISVVFLAPRMNFIFSLLVSLVLQVVIAFFILTKLGGLSFKP